MAQKSTRARIKYQADKIQSQLDRCLIHLKAIDELSQSSSEVINEWMPPLTETFVNVKKIVATFQSQL